MNEYLDGVAQGVKEGPLVFVTPVVAVILLLSSTVRSLLKRQLKA
ncbi:hypothetical protein [Stenotrophomonas maltophilia]|nr:hypothetical protein [Stenotrophomonas maltophilia]